MARGGNGWALRNSETVTANSGRTAQDLIAMLGVPAQKIHTVYRGADPPMRPITADDRIAARAWLGKDAERPLAVFVGALGFDTRKGIDTLFAAWRRLCARGDWDVDLVVAGGGRRVGTWGRPNETAGPVHSVK